MLNRQRREVLKTSILLVSLAACSDQVPTILTGGEGITAGDVGGAFSGGEFSSGGVTGGAYTGGEQTAGVITGGEHVASAQSAGDEVLGPPAVARKWVVKRLILAVTSLRHSASTVARARDVTHPLFKET